MRVFPAVMVLGLGVSACAGAREVRYPLTPRANDCQITEIRASVLSTVVMAVCWDATGRALGMAGTGGMPAAQVPLTILGAASAVAGPVAGATILGGDLVEAATRLQTIRGAVTVAPDLAGVEQQIRDRLGGL